MKSSTTPAARAEWDFSTCFAFLSPLIGILVGFLELALVRSLKLQLNRKTHSELKEPYSKKNKQPPELAEVFATTPPRARPDARLQYVAVQFRTGLHSPESTRERLGMKTGGRAHIS